MNTLLLVLLIVAAVMIVWMVFWGLFWLLVQGGVIARVALTPPTTDSSNYSLNQSREVRSEEQ